MSAKVSAGSCLEGTPTIPIDIGPQASFLGRIGQEVHGSAKDFPEATLQCRQAKQVHMGSRIKFCGEVDVARGGGVTSSNGTEQRQMTDTSPPEFGLAHQCGQGGRHSVERALRLGTSALRLTLGFLGLFFGFDIFPEAADRVGPISNAPCS